MKITISHATLMLLAAAGMAAALESPSAVPPVSAAPPTPNTITVSSSGKSVMAPNYLSMKAGVNGNAELAEEAVANFVQARTRATGALAEAEFGDVEINSGGLTVEYTPEPDGDPNMGRMVFSGGQQPEAPKYGVNYKENFEVRFTPADGEEAQRNQVARAIDTALDLELSINKIVFDPYRYPQRASTSDASIVRGELSDEAKLESEMAAQADAMERARVLAANLAELSGRALGKISSVNLSTLKTEWKGLGVGVETTATISVTFELER